jgi:hypothetical protein
MKSVSSAYEMDTPASRPIYTQLSPCDCMCACVHRSVHSYILSLFPDAPTLELRASAKRFVSLQFLNPKTVGRTPWRGGSARRKFATYKGQHKQNKRRQTSIP